MVEIFPHIRNRWQAVNRVYPWSFIGFLTLIGIIKSISTLLFVFWTGRISPDAFAVMEQNEFLLIFSGLLDDIIPLGILALVAQNYHNRDKVVEIIKAGLILQIFIALLITCTASFFLRDIVGIIGTPQAIADQTHAYLMLTLITLPIEGIAYLLIVAVKSLQKGKEACILIIINVIMNIVLNLFLVSDTSVSLHLGTPGTAISYFCSQMVVIIVSGFYLTRFLSLDLFSILKSRWQIHILPVFRIGVWTGLSSVLMNLGYLAVLFFFNQMGTTAYGGYNLAYVSIWLITLPVFGLGTATSVIVGNYFGEKRFADLLVVVKVSVTLVTGAMLAYCGIMILGWKEIIGFIIPDTAMVVYSAIVFWYLVIPCTGVAIGIILRSIFYGTGRTRYTFYISCIINAGVILPFFVLTATGYLKLDFHMTMMVFSFAYLLDPILSYYWARNVVAEFPFNKNGSGSKGWRG